MAKWCGKHGFQGQNGVENIVFQGQNGVENIAFQGQNGVENIAFQAKWCGKPCFSRAK